MYGCCHKNEHKQGRVALQAVSVTPRPQPYTAVFNIMIIITHKNIIISHNNIVI